MRSVFPGYFTPTKEEFAKLWGESVFAFDANVLLGLYRSTSETQQVFFTVFDKIADRMFLPNQAAFEYLKNRLGVISIRSDQYGKIKSESEKLAKSIESIVQEQAIQGGDEIAKTAKDSSNRIGELVETGIKQEPDLLRSDRILEKLATLFETNTGQPYSPERLKEIYADGAQRYAKGIPPGYKDDKKGEPDKYGDLLIWNQLIDYAKLKKKPIIFVTGDAKEDWLLQHRGETFGPRPELRQEMMVLAGVHFYVYTAPKFLEFAKEFLGLQLDTRKAESEFEKIEKQDKQAAEEIAIKAATYYTDYADYPPATNPTWQSWNTNYLGNQPFRYQFNTMGDESYVPFSAPADPVSQSKYLTLLPINGAIYQSSTGKWKCEIVSYPDSEHDGRVRYKLKFAPEGRVGPSRNLRLWVSVARLQRDSDWRHKTFISGAIVKWLGSNDGDGEIGPLV